MRDGLLKVATATPAIHVADCIYNTQQILKVFDQAVTEQVKVLVLPELCITGYTCGDLFLHQTLLDGAKQSLLTLAKATKGLQLLTVVGVPLMQRDKLYNCAAVLFEGEILGIVPKTHLPTYGEYYERRQFTPAQDSDSDILLFDQHIPFGTDLLFTAKDQPELCLGVEICEDLWVPDSPSRRLCTAGATVIANPSAGDEVIGKADYRRKLIEMQSAKLLCGYLYASAGDGESTTDMVFAGHNLIAENGSILAQTKLFENGMAISELDVQKLIHERRRTTTYVNVAPMRSILFDLTPTDTSLTRFVAVHPFAPDDRFDRESRCELILNMQANGLQKRIAHTNCKTIVVGISGGLDSCLALLVMVRAMDALGRDRADILAVTMPCFGTTHRTKSNAEALSEALGVTLQCVDIQPAVLQHLNDLQHDVDALDITYENAQARERTQVLMNLANKHGGMVVGTGDLSELALGWATYNGDHMSMYGVNASIPKTLVRHIVRYFADQSDEAIRTILLDILDTPVSPELLPPKDGEIAQQTEQVVGPYELHDFFLYYILRFGFPPKKVYRFACYAFAAQYDNATILQWLRIFYRRFFSQQFKRSCLPDGPKVGSVTLSPRGDWRMPSDAVATLWMNQLEELA